MPGPAQRHGGGEHSPDDAHEVGTGAGAGDDGDGSGGGGGGSRRLEKRGGARSEAHPRDGVHFLHGGGVSSQQTNHALGLAPFTVV